MNNDLKFDFNDILICPSVITNIESRSHINVFYPDGNLPLITAPMDTVILEKNEHVFIENNIIPCLPRGEKAGPRSIESFSLNEMLNKFKSKELKKHRGYLIDTANGHIKKLKDVTRMIKNELGDDIWLMIGNIANPKSYAELSEAGADAIRIGIGNGGGCLTTQQTGVGYPMASLIKECYIESLSLNNPAKIVADGGMKDYSDVIKALALGADFVMMGSIFNKAIESSGKNVHYSNAGETELSLEEALDLFNSGRPVFKSFRGMSTKEVQRKWGRINLKTSEGIVDTREAQYTLSSWVENFKHYLRSAMSYTNSSDLNEFIGETHTIMITKNSLDRFKK
jgi:IMP dehydrogenase/GMP reductase